TTRICTLSLHDALPIYPAVELLAFPTGFVADRAVGPDGRDLHARIGHAQLDEELFDRLGALPGQQLVVLGRALTVGVALDEDRRSEEHTSELQSRGHLV